MYFEDLKKLYTKKRQQFGSDAYKHVSELLKEAKEIHKKDWLKHPTPSGDHEQSWRAFKGKNLEKLIQYIITEEVESLGLKVINGNKLERTRYLPMEFSKVKRNLAIDYGNFGLHLPDVDIIIYHPKTYKVLVVISSKVTLRERIAQTGYWKLKFLQHMKPPKKGRAIVEVDLDGSYILTEEKVEESEKVKLFEHFIDDLKRLLNDEK